MKNNYMIPIVIILGIIILFFFPEPETNFITYIATAAIFVIITIILIVWKRKK